MNNTKKIVLTNNQKMVLETLNKVKGEGFAYQVHELLKEKTFNSVNATLASLEKKGFVTKQKKVCESKNKMLTHYKITELGTSTLNKDKDA